MDKFFSVVIPTYNRKDTLKEVLLSLSRQSYPEEKFEILVCDSNSSDGTAEMVKSLGIPNLFFFSRDNKGRSGARNHGIENAKGEIVLFTDADIIADENLIMEHNRLHSQYEKIAVVGCEVKVDTFEEYLQIKGDTSRWRRLHPDNRKELPWLYFLTGNASASRNVLLQAGKFDESFTGYGHEDLELGYRLKKMGIKIKYNSRAVNFHWHPVGFDEQCGRMHLAGKSTVRFYLKHKDPQIKFFLGATPLSLGLHSLIAPEGSVMKFCRKKKDTVKLCSEIVLQHNYLSGVKAGMKEMGRI